MLEYLVVLDKSIKYNEGCELENIKYSYEEYGYGHVRNEMSLWYDGGILTIRAFDTALEVHDKNHYGHIYIDEYTFTNRYFDVARGEGKFDFAVKREDNAFEFIFKSKDNKYEFSFVACLMDELKLKMLVD